MPHSRQRHAQPLLLKKIGFARVVSIQGARQTGKSYLARELLAKSLKKSQFVSFDQTLPRSFAESNPDAFLESQSDAHPLILDEAQKVPEIFDAIKHQADIRPSPGRYLLLGSTEFSREVRIRESLTGRLSRVRLYPFNLAESLQLPPNPSRSPALIQDKPRVSRAELLRHLERGGLPGIFAVRDAIERKALLKDWLELACTRDLLQFPALRPDPELAMQLFQELARRPLADQAELVRATGGSARRIKEHLDALVRLFAIEKVPPHPSGTGKARYILCDTGIVHALQGNFRSGLLTWVIGEYLSQHSYRASDVKLWTYRGSRGGLIEVVLENGPDELHAIKVLSDEHFDLRDLEILKSFTTRARAKGIKKIKTLALAPVHTLTKMGAVNIHPWEAIG